MGILGTRNGMLDTDHPERYEFDPEEIAINLGRIHRFSGHTRRPVTVAEHSVRVYQFARVLGESPMSALIHDAAEAFLGDIPTPVKPKEIQEIEDRIVHAIADQWGIEYEYPKISDALALYLEASIEGPAHWTWPKSPIPEPEKFIREYSVRNLWIELVSRLTRGGSRV